VVNPADFEHLKDMGLAKLQARIRAYEIRRAQATKAARVLRAHDLD
jgi:hypothetical protein